MKDDNERLLNERCLHREKLGHSAVSGCTIVGLVAFACAWPAGAPCLVLAPGYDAEAIREPTTRLEQ